MKSGTMEYFLLHHRIRKILGRPKRCEHCNRTDAKRYDWANISGEYKENDVADWKRLCRSCHIIFDSNGMCRKNLHKMVGKNVYINPSGKKECNECKKMYRKDYYWTHKKGVE